MPIYYQKIPQNEENESMNSINSTQVPKANFLRQSRANSYYELSEFDSGSSLLSLDQIYLEENVELERIETRYGSVVVGKQVYATGRSNANGNVANGSNAADQNASNVASQSGGHTEPPSHTVGNGIQGVPGTTTAHNGGTVHHPPASNGGPPARKPSEMKSNELKSNAATNGRKEPKRAKLNSIILTVHDIGLNHESNFLAFFNNLNTKILLKNFTVYHLNLPGQHTSSEQISPIYAYPTMDQMSEIIDFVVGYYEIDNFIGFGTGAGANLLIRFAIKKPNKVNGLFLINPTYSQASWVEWIYQKRNIKHLQADRNSEKHQDRSLLLSPIVQDYLIWHQFGKTSPERETDSLRIIEEYRSYFKSRFIDSINLSLFIDSYVKRKCINLSRDGLKGTNKLQCECTILAGSLSSMRSEANQLYLRLAPDKANWIKFSNCGNPLLEKPVKVLEIFKLMLLGLGYTIKQPRSQIAIKNAMKKSASVGLVLNEPANSCLIDFFTPN